MKRFGFREGTIVCATLSGLILASCSSTGQTGRVVPAPAASAQTAPSSPRRIFLDKCTRCHTADRSYGFLNRKDVWVNKVAVMASKDLKWIGPGDLRTIIAYYEAHPGVVKEAFGGKCGGCHRWESLRQLAKSDTQWRTMVKFMGLRAPGGVSDDEVDLLARALGGPI